MFGGGRATQKQVPRNIRKFTSSQVSRRDRFSAIDNPFSYG
jgi:hypothetical protein